MCGIFGFTNSLDDPKKTLKLMGQSLAHRGPDDESFFFNSSVSIGMRRLSILDINNGNQPFFNEDKSVVCVCNGEIYNFVELKKELKSKGYRFNTNNDVEVLPSLYQEFGIEFIHKLNGMFAIALYDVNKSKLFIARDRLGIKPLYYFHQNNEVVFSSEIKSILSTSLINAELNQKAINSFIDLNFIPHPQSPIKEIYKLEPGSYIIKTPTSFEINNFWEPEFSPNSKINISDVVDEFRYLIKDSIKLRLQSDVPIGSFLSGGIDSSYITSIASKLTNEDFHVFNMRFSGTKNQKNESKNANELANSLNVKKVFKKKDEINFINILPKLIYFLDEPLADPAFLPTYYLSKLASEKVKVIFSGAGGDEVFGGYNRYTKISKTKSFFKSTFQNKNPHKSYYDILKIKNQSALRKIFQNYEPDHFKYEFDKCFTKNKDSDYTNSMMLNDLKYYLQDDILLLTDKMTMGNSIECRVPFLDHRIVELSLKLHSSVKMMNGNKKFLLKKIIGDEISSDILESKKQGFEFPISDLINNNKFLYFDPLLQYGYLLKNSIINKNAIHSFTLKTRLNSTEEWIYWKMVILEIWYRIFIEGQNTDDIFTMGSYYLNNE